MCGEGHRKKEACCFQEDKMWNIALWTTLGILCRPPRKDITRRQDCLHFNYWNLFLLKWIKSQKNWNDEAEFKPTCMKGYIGKEVNKMFNEIDYSKTKLILYKVNKRRPPSCLTVMHLTIIKLYLWYVNVHIKINFIYPF